MIPDPHTTSAFVFYNGLVGETSSMKRRRRKQFKKEREEESLEQSSSEVYLKNKEEVTVESPFLTSSKPKRNNKEKSKDVTEESPFLTSPKPKRNNKEKNKEEVIVESPFLTSPKPKRNKKEKNKEEEIVESPFLTSPKPKRKKILPLVIESDCGDVAKVTSSVNEEKNANPPRSIFRNKMSIVKRKVKTKVQKPTFEIETPSLQADISECSTPQQFNISSETPSLRANISGSRSLNKFDITSSDPVEVNKSKKHTKLHEKRLTGGDNLREDINSHKCGTSDGNTFLAKTSRSAKKKALKEKLATRRKALKASVQKVFKGKTSSADVGRKVLETLISPTTVDTFFKVYWEKKPLLINRNQSGYFKKYLSIKEIDDMLRYNVLMFSRNLDITSYSDGKRETHNPTGRAHPHVVWDYYSNKCSIRILNPQTYLHKIHTLLAALQEYFGCFVGSNVYLTPPNSQGFAPHYDDIEAFVLQIEGAKRWRVYAPRQENELLPRYSSPNFSHDEIGEPVLDVTLKAGDILYFPRGFIHQAETLPDEHSLHITISAYQKTAWIDLIEKAMPNALEQAWKNHVEFRKGLPIGYLNQAGLGYPHIATRREIHVRMKKLLTLLERHLDVDSAVDAMGVKFMHEALPPVLSKEESECSVHDGGLVMREDGLLRNRVELNEDTNIRLLRANCCRLVEEIVEGEGPVAKLYTTVENSKVFEEEEPQFLIIPGEMVPAIQHLMSSYPSYIPICSLPLPTDEEKLLLAGDLWDQGVLLTESPLLPTDEAIKEKPDSE